MATDSTAPSTLPDPTPQIIPRTPANHIGEASRYIAPTAWGRGQTKIVLRGDVHAAEKLIPLAKQRARQGHNINGLDKDSLEIYDLPYRLSNGTKVDFQRRFEQDTVFVTVPPRLQDETIRRPFTFDFDGSGLDVEEVETWHDRNFGYPMAFDSSYQRPGLASFGNQRTALLFASDQDGFTFFSSDELRVSRDEPRFDYTMFLTGKVINPGNGNVQIAMVYGNKKIAADFLTLNASGDNTSNYVGFNNGTYAGIASNVPYTIALVSRVLSDVDGYSGSYSWFDRTLICEKSLYINSQKVTSVLHEAGYLSEASPATWMAVEADCSSNASGHLAQSSFCGTAFSHDSVRRVSDGLMKKWGF